MSNLKQTSYEGLRERVPRAVQRVARSHSASSVRRVEREGGAERQSKEALQSALLLVRCRLLHRLPISARAVHQFQRADQVEY